jgi:hypothetical protein
MERVTICDFCCAEICYCFVHQVGLCDRTDYRPYLASIGENLSSLKTITSLAQECISQSPVILLGSGASAAHGIPGMGRLGDHLIKSVLPGGLTKADISGWDAFLAHLPTSNLEQALTDIALTLRMTQHVVSTTWDFLNPYDIAIFEQLCADRKLLPLTKLYQHLFRSTTREIDVVTPNYDRLAEYAADAGGYVAYSGFTFGALASRASNPAPKIFNGNSQSRTVNVWKVHGSFGWFADADGIVVGLPPAQNRPKALESVIITPGIEKYRRTHDEPFRTTMQNADRAMRAASAFLCIGYGFNDQHLQPLLVERCYAQNVLLVLVTQKISDTAHEFFRSGKCQRYLAMEQSGNATKFFCNEIPDGTELSASSYWQLSEFLSLIM